MWDVKAYRELEAFWERATPIGPAVDAFDEMERLLADAPGEQGESRPLGRRILHVAPLAIIYRINERLKEVHVLDVWMFDVHR